MRAVAEKLARFGQARWTGAALLSAGFLLFLIANRGAYKGWFSGDELDNLFWTPYVSWRDFLRGFLTPQFYAHNFRPAGHFFFSVLKRTADLDFRWYVASVHLLHWANVGLVYLAARRLDSSRRSAAAAALFFAFPMAAFDALWKPMYVFDVLCTMFCLLCLVAYTGRRYITAFVCLWAAYKSKELAVMLPLALALVEWRWGERRWLRLAPFFGVSLLFGAQALLAREAPGPAYRLAFSLAALETTVRFYASRAFLLPWAGLLTLGLPIIFRDRRVLLGTAAFWALLAPVLFLPMRTYAAYLYLPLAFFSIAVAGMAEGRRLGILAIAAVVWLGANHWAMRRQRAVALRDAGHHRAYFAELKRSFREEGKPVCMVYDPPPPGLAAWGVNAAIRLASGDPRLRSAMPLEPNGHECLAREGAALLAWDSRSGKLAVLRHRAGEAPPPYMNIDNTTPVWFLGRGWHERDVYFRWIEPRATARLTRPADASTFEVKVNVGQLLLARVKASTLEALLDGRSIGSRTFERPGLQTAIWKIPNAPAGAVEVEFRVTPALEQDGKRYGIAICGFGFPPEASSGQ